MSRSLKKGPYVDERVRKKALQAKQNNDRKPIKTWSRACTITPEMVGLTFAVHNGKNFIEVFIDENKVGHKLGEFALTRKFIVHGGRMAREEQTDQAKKEATGTGAAASAAKQPSPAK